MTKDLMEQYPDICAELRELGRCVSDTVVGSMTDPPYTPHTISVEGVRYSEGCGELERQKREIEAFVADIPDAGLRRIVRYRAMEGLTWQQVAAKMGHRYSPDAARKQYEKIFQ